MKTPSDRLQKINERINDLTLTALVVESRLTKAGEFREEDHPRADDGRFGEKPGEHEGEKEKPENKESPKDNPGESIKIDGANLKLTDEDGDAVYIKEAYKDATGKEIDFDGSHGIDVRYNSSNSDPLSDYGHAMFVNGDHEDRVQGYGSNRWVYDRSTGVDIEDLKEEFTQKWNEAMESGGIIAENNTRYDDTSAEEMWESVDPKDIVDAAEFWDDGKLMQWFYENIAEPGGIGAINTQDGSIVWDKDLIKYAGKSVK
jgi:hypothetical protein